MDFYGLLLLFYAALVNTTHGFIGYGMFYMPNGMVILRRMWRYRGKVRITIFVSMGTAHCFYPFINFCLNFNFSIGTFCLFWGLFVCELNMTMLSCIVCQSLTFQLTLRRILRTFDQMHPGYNCAKNYGRNLKSMFNLLLHAKKHLYVQNDSNEGYVSLWNLSCKKFWSLTCI